MAFKNLADLSSQNMYNFSYEQKAVVVYPLLSDQKPTLLLRCELFTSLAQISLRICNINPTKRAQLPQNYFGTPTCPPFLCFGSENAQQLFPQCQLEGNSSRDRKQNHCLTCSFGNKSMSSHILTEQVIFVLIYTVRNCGFPVSVKYGLQLDYGLPTLDYGLGIKHRLRYEMQIEHY